MSKHLEVKLIVKGDLVSAISESLSIAKAIKQDLFLTIWNSKDIRIGAESNVQDLISIAILEGQLKKAEEALNPNSKEE